MGLIITLCCNYSYAQGLTLQISKNPTTCNGSEGSLTFGVLTPNASYQVSYNDDGATIGPITLVANGAGELSITGLNKGSYTCLLYTSPSPRD